MAFGLAVVQQRAELGARRVVLAGEPLGEQPGRFLLLAAGLAEAVCEHPEDDGAPHPEGAVAVADVVHEPEAEDERQDRAEHDERQRDSHQPEELGDLARAVRSQRE